jgi:hypothetical protein
LLPGAAARAAICWRIWRRTRAALSLYTAGVRSLIAVPYVTQRRLGRDGRTALVYLVVELLHVGAQRGLGLADLPAALGLGSST